MPSSTSSLLDLDPIAYFAMGGFALFFGLFFFVLLYDIPLFLYVCGPITVIPGVIGPAPGGLSYWQAVELLQGAAQRATIAAFDIVEFMPERDIQKQGALAAARLMANAIGLIARQRKR